MRQLISYGRVPDYLPNRSTRIPLRHDACEVVSFMEVIERGTADRRGGPGGGRRPDRRDDLAYRYGQEGRHTAQVAYPDRPCPPAQGQAGHDLPGHLPVLPG